MATREASPFEQATLLCERATALLLVALLPWQAFWLLTQLEDRQKIQRAS